MPSGRISTTALRFTKNEMQRVYAALVAATASRSN